MSSNGDVWMWVGRYVICVTACLGGWVCTTKPLDRNDLKLGTVVFTVVIDTMSKPTDFGFMWARVYLGFKVRLGSRCLLASGDSRKCMYTF